MAIVAAIVSGFALIALVISYMTVRTERKAMKKALSLQGTGHRGFNESEY